MRKRSRYRPKPILRNPVGYVVESVTPLTHHNPHVLTLKIKNHAAMVSLVRGEATKEEFDRLVAAANVVEALYMMGFGAEYKDVVVKGHAALMAAGQRGYRLGRFVLKSDEMSAINDLMELHDAQLEVITVKHLEKAIALVSRERQAGRTKDIISKEERLLNEFKFLAGESNDSNREDQTSIGQKPQGASGRTSHQAGGV